MDQIYKKFGKFPIPFGGYVSQYSYNRMFHQCKPIWSVPKKIYTCELDTTKHKEYVNFDLYAELKDEPPDKTSEKPQFSDDASDTSVDNPKKNKKKRKKKNKAGIKPPPKPENPVLKPESPMNTEETLPGDTCIDATSSGLTPSPMSSNHLVQEFIEQLPEEQLCHLCNMTVRTKHVFSHLISTVHMNSAKLAQHFMSRTASFIKDPLLGIHGNVELKEYCAYCDIEIPSAYIETHNATWTHKAKVIKLQLIQDLIPYYENDPNQNVYIDNKTQNNQSTQTDVLLQSVTESVQTILKNEEKQNKEVKDEIVKTSEVKLEPKSVKLFVDNNKAEKASVAKVTGIISDNAKNNIKNDIIITFVPEKEKNVVTPAKKKNKKNVTIDQNMMINSPNNHKYEKPKFGDAFKKTNKKITIHGSVKTVKSKSEKIIESKSKNKIKKNPSKAATVQETLFCYICQVAVPKGDYEVHCLKRKHLKKVEKNTKPNSYVRKNRPVYYKTEFKAVTVTDTNETSIIENKPIEEEKNTKPNSDVRKNRPVYYKTEVKAVTDTDTNETPIIENKQTKVKKNTKPILDVRKNRPVYYKTEVKGVTDTDTNETSIIENKPIEVEKKTNPNPDIRKNRSVYYKTEVKAVTDTDTNETSIIENKPTEVEKNTNPNSDIRKNRPVYYKTEVKAVTDTDTNETSIIENKPIEVEKKTNPNSDIRKNRSVYYKTEVKAVTDTDTNETSIIENKPTEVEKNTNPNSDIRKNRPVYYKTEVKAVTDTDTNETSIIENKPTEVEKNTNPNSDVRKNRPVYYKTEVKGVTDIDTNETPIIENKPTTESKKKECATMIVGNDDSNTVDQPQQTINVNDKKNTNETQIDSESDNDVMEDCRDENEEEYFETDKAESGSDHDEEQGLDEATNIKKQIVQDSKNSIDKKKISIPDNSDAFNQPSTSKQTEVTRDAEPVLDQPFSQILKNNGSNVESAFDTPLNARENISRILTNNDFLRFSHNRLRNRMTFGSMTQRFLHTVNRIAHEHKYKAMKDNIKIINLNMYYCVYCRLFKPDFTSFGLHLVSEEHRNTVEERIVATAHSRLTPSELRFMNRLPNGDILCQCCKIIIRDLEEKIIHFKTERHIAESTKLSFVLRMQF